MLDNPRFNNGNYKCKGGYKTDLERDTAMTIESDKDILWYRTVEEQKKKYGKKYRSIISGTENNEKRRTEMKK